MQHREDESFKMILCLLSLSLISVSCPPCSHGFVHAGRYIWLGLSPSNALMCFSVPIHATGPSPVYSDPLERKHHRKGITPTCQQASLGLQTDAVVEIGGVSPDGSCVLLFLRRPYAVYTVRVDSWLPLTIHPDQVKKAHIPVSLLIGQAWLRVSS